VKTLIGVIAAAGTLAAAAQVHAQPQRGLPHGSYERSCTDIRMQGQFLSATCRGAHGGGASSINVQSCAGDIGVDDSGALVCAGPGAAPTPGPAYGQAAPSYRDDRRAPPPPPAYGDRDRGYGERDRGGYRDREDRRGFGGVTLFGGREMRGPSIRIDGPTRNLSGIGLNDRVRSIELDRRSGPWLVCSDADFRGRCVTIDRSIEDTRRIGLGDAISSLRPLR
jgi:hypothetical protein